MSENINPLPTVSIEDDLVRIPDKVAFAVLQGPASIGYKTVNANSFSQSKANFTLNPASPEIFLDRFLLYRQPVRITLTRNIAIVGVNVWQSGHTAFRAFPLSSVMSTMVIRPNNSTENIDLQNTIDVFQRFNNDFWATNYLYSTTPTYRDQSQSYNELTETVRNPLGSVFDSTDLSAELRGAFPIRIISNSTTVCVIEADLAEPLFISPLYFGPGDKQGFTGLSQFNIDITFGELSQMISHSSEIGPIDLVEVELLRPSILIKEATPDLIESIPKSTEFPYFLVDFKNQFFPSAIAPGATQTLTFNSIQLESIPHSVYICCRKQKTTRDITDTDTFFAIDQINVTFMARNGLLSSASREDLYRIYRNRGGNMSWRMWSGDTTEQTTGVGPAQIISGVGGVLALNFGTDIGLESDLSPGIGGSFTFSYRLSVRNIHPINFIEPELIAIFVFNGVYNIDKGRIFTTVGPLSTKDVIDTNIEAAKSIPLSVINGINGLQGQSMMDAQFGEAIGGQDFGTDFIKGLESVGDIAASIFKFLPLLGLGGQDEKLIRDALKKRNRKKGSGVNVGGVLVGGQQMKRRLLQERAKRLKKR